MGIKELRDKYGDTKGHKLVNRAIRGEIVGGDDLLDAMDLVDRLVQRLRERNLAGADEAQAALDHLQRLRTIQGNVIADRYGMARQ